MDRLCHFEVPYSDNQRVQKFNSNVFGCQFSPVPGDMPYTFVVTTPVNEMFQPHEPCGINGGMYPHGDESGSSSPVIVIQVQNSE